MAAREEETGIQNRQKDRAAVLPMVLIVLISSTVGVILGLLIDWFPTPASTQSDPIDTLWDVLVIASVPIFVGVQSFVLYCVWRFRMRPGQELQDGPPIHGNTTLEVVWTVIPALLILGLCAYAYFVLEDIEEAKANEWRINVTGQQFTWTFEYPKEVTGGEPVRSSQLYVPEGQPVHFHINSPDVIHSFWVPAWRMKIDAVPGLTTKVRMTPNRLGRFSIVCAELCGIGHAYMRQTANVVTREDFDAWLEQKQSRGGTAGGGAAGGEEVDGKTLFTEGNGEATACGSCHTLADAGATGSVGPNLDDARPSYDLVVDRVTNGSGAMPAFEGRLSEQQIRDVAAYVSTAAGS